MFEYAGLRADRDGYLGWVRGETRSMAKLNSVSGMMVDLRISGETSLFILLGADGGITRLGAGTVDNGEHDMCIGITDAAVFQGLRQQIGPELLSWFGQQLAHPKPLGKLCDLTVGLKDADGEELAAAWRYGSESAGPPKEVSQFVIAALTATNPWYERQKAMARAGGRQTRRRP